MSVPVIEKPYGPAREDSPFSTVKTNTTRTMLLGMLAFDGLRAPMLSAALEDSYQTLQQSNVAEVPA
ncbi:hypothetical protein LG290_08325 [Halomonas sediminis]